MSSCCPSPDIDLPTPPSWTARSPRAGARPPWHGLAALSGRMAGWFGLDPADRLMVHLDERMLRDVGLTEADLPRAVRRERLERNSAAWRLLETSGR